MADSVLLLLNNALGEPEKCVDVLYLLSNRIV